MVTGAAARSQKPAAPQVGAGKRVTIDRALRTDGGIRPDLKSKAG